MWIRNTEYKETCIWKQPSFIATHCIIPSSTETRLQNIKFTWPHWLCFYEICAWNWKSVQNSLTVFHLLRIIEGTHFCRFPKHLLCAEVLRHVTKVRVNCFRLCRITAARLYWAICQHVSTTMITQLRLASALDGYVPQLRVKLKTGSLPVLKSCCHARLFVRLFLLSLCAWFVQATVCSVWIFSK